MDHRRRLMQHKTEQSTLLKIVLAKTKNWSFPHGKINDRCVINALATAAIESVKKYDAPYKEGDCKKQPITKNETAVVFHHGLDI